MEKLRGIAVQPRSRSDLDFRVVEAPHSAGPGLRQHGTASGSGDCAGPAEAADFPCNPSTICTTITGTTEEDAGRA